MDIKFHFMLQTVQILKVDLFFCFVSFDSVKCCQEQQQKTWTMIRHPRKNKPSFVPKKARSGLKWKLRMCMEISSCKLSCCLCCCKEE